MFAHAIGGVMYKVIFLFLFSSVLTFTSFLYAATLPQKVSVPLESIKFNDASMTVKLRGILPNRCAVSPQPLLLKSKEDGVLILDIVADNFAEACITLVGGKFELAFDIRSLKFNLVDLNLDPNATYKIITADGALDVIVNFGKSVFNRPYSSTEIFGSVFAVENNGQFVVAVSPTEAFQMKSPFIDMSAYVGKTVQVQGHVVNITNPGLKMNHSDAPTILVTGISTTVH